MRGVENVPYEGGPKSLFGRGVIREVFHPPLFFHPPMASSDIGSKPDRIPDQVRSSLSPKDPKIVNPINPRS